MKKLLIVLFVLAFEHTKAQELTFPSFRHFSAKDINLKTMYGFAWDKDGRTWAVCEEGIVCYNGYSTCRFKHLEGDSNTILSNAIQGLFIDKKNDLFITYLDKPALSKMNLKTEKLVHFYADSNSTTSVPSVPISGFKEDSKGNFWLLTWGEGIFKMDRETGKCKAYKPNLDKPNDNHYPKAYRCKSMFELPDGRFLAGFWGFNGLSSFPAYFDPIKETFTEIDIEPYLKDVKEERERKNITSSLKIIHFVYVDNDGNWWFGSYSGLIFLDNKNKIAKRISPNKIESTMINLDNAARYVVDENGIIWIASPVNGLMLVNPKTQKAWYVKHDSKNSESLIDNLIRSMRKDPEGNIWIATESGITSIYLPLTQNFKIKPWEELGLDYSNRSAQVIPVNQINVHSNGLIYIASGTGLTVYNPVTFEVVDQYDAKKLGLNYGTQPDAASRVVSFRFLDSNKVFIVGWADRGELDLKTRKFKHYDIETPSDLIELYTKEKRKVHSFGLLFKYDTSIPILNQIDPWLGRIYGVDNKNSTTLKQKAFLNNPYYGTGDYSYLTKDGKWLICGGEKRFIIFDPINNSVTNYSYKDSLHYFPDTTIAIIYKDKKEQYWFGTKSGLYLFDYSTKKAKYMNPVLGLGNEQVTALIEDNNGDFWMALEKEILYWNPTTNKTFKYGREFGLNANSLLAYMPQKGPDGTLYFASSNGLVSFHPDKLKIPTSKNILQIHLISIKDDTLNKARLEEFSQGKTTLTWNKNFINFELSANSTFPITPHTFSYRLIGLDTSWQNNDISNRIRFTNLSPESYTLEVKIINAFDIESEVLAIPFIISPPFWRTWWFYSLAGGTIVLIGYAYMRYRERRFRKKQEILEAKIKERTSEVVAKAKEIEQQKDIILEKNKELTDSIHYALRIQKSILPDEKHIKKGLPEHFIYFKPKDIVSGDFYWYSEQKDSVLWAVVDCTGHGVPGGFMSMLGSGLLNQIVNEELKLEPDIILNNLRERVIIALKQTGEYGDSRDGMDIAFCRYLPKENKIQFAGANNGLYLVRKGELIELDPDKQPIGIHAVETKPFTLKEIILEKGDCIYTTSDGYADQFGGEKGKKFKTSNLEKLFVEISKLNINEQHIHIDKTFNEWRGVYDQLDDVCVMGVRL